jgi:8-oxo-dGTP pyrophosphatase MutT (NUDIX family)
MASNLPIRDAVSAGGIVWRRGEAGEIEVVICGRTAENVWGLPKGTPDPGESLEQTAVREVEEETGLHVAPGESVGAIDYWFTRDGVRFHKQVHHWLMEPTGGDVAHHDAEFDAVEWVPVGRALRMLSYGNERKVLARAMELLGVKT